jgi:phosphate transport system protein
VPDRANTAISTRDLNYRVEQHVRDEDVFDEVDELDASCVISRHLERVGDHAANVAEDVIFIVSGRDVRQRAGDQLS